MILTRAELSRRHIRRSQYRSCDDAFIDVRLPGSTPKENYSIVGPGVTQNPRQVVDLRKPHGFNIGAAGMAPKHHQQPAPALHGRNVHRL